MMSKFGPVRAVEVEPSAPRDDPDTGSGGGAAAAPPSAGGGARHNKKNGRGNDAGAADFDVDALLSNMPKPRALAKGNRGSGGSGGKAAGRTGDGGSGGLAGGASDGDALSVGLHVDAWVQFGSFRGFRRALSALTGRVLKKAGAELLCEYRLGVDVSGYMTEERRRARVAVRAKRAKEVRGGERRGSRGRMFQRDRMSQQRAAGGGGGGGAGEDLSKARNAGWQGEELTACWCE